MPTVIKMVAISTKEHSNHSYVHTMPTVLGNTYPTLTLNLGKYISAFNIPNLLPNASQASFTIGYELQFIKLYTCQSLLKQIMFLNL